MQCLTSVTYSFIINGASRGHVKPGRGIRQGDPLSPYLFILRSETLSCLCNLGQKTGKFKGIKIASGCPSINHLLFADDTMFFCSANEKNAKTLSLLLAAYESVSGQLINSEKSSISFSHKTNQTIRTKVKQSLGINTEGGVGKYMGLPEHFGRRKRDLFASIVDRTKQKSISWSTKFLSRAGKMIMLRTILAAMPSHAMSCFKLPQSLCSRIQSTLTRFWWDSIPEKKKVSWISWKRMAKSKKHEGLGFKDITMYNDALLAKLGWRILKNPSSLLACCLLGKYCKAETFLNIKPSKASSHGWRSVLIGRDLLTSHLGWIVGTGTSFNIWSDPWFSSSDQERPFGPAPEALQHLRVSDLILADSIEWDIEKLEQILPFHKYQILKINPSLCGNANELVWLKTSNGEYSTKSGYRAQAERLEMDEPISPIETIDWQSLVWKAKTSEKIKLFLWNSLHGSLPVGEQLAIRHIPVSNLCPRCKEVEMRNHILFTCPFAIKVWKAAPLALPFRSERITSAVEGIKMVSRSPTLPPTGLGPGSLPAWIYWNLWISCNQLIFQKRDLSPEQTLTKAITEAWEWSLAQEPSTNQRASTPAPNPIPILPPGAIRLYTDAAWNKSMQCAGLGWSFDDSGSITSLSTTSSSVTSPLMAETLVLRKSLISAFDRGSDSLLVLFDSQMLINLINNQSRNLEIAGILNDIYLLSRFLILSSLSLSLEQLML